MQLLARLIALTALASVSHGFTISSVPIGLRGCHGQRLAHARIRNAALCCRAAAEGPGTYALNVNLYVKEERREEFLKCILENQRGTMTDEPLAVLYDFGSRPPTILRVCYAPSGADVRCATKPGESDTERNTFHFQASSDMCLVECELRIPGADTRVGRYQEQYLGREGFEAHTKAPHFAKWEEFAVSELLFNACLRARCKP